MFTFPEITYSDAQNSNWNATLTSPTEASPSPANALSVKVQEVAQETISYPIAPLSFEGHPLRARREWLDPEFRQGYMEASVEEGIAWQIKANRRGRKISQKELAVRIGSKQAAISRLEDPTYGKYSLETLIKVAHAFDCALSVRFISYAKLAIESADLSPTALYAEGFSSDRMILEN